MKDQFLYQSMGRHSRESCLQALTWGKLTDVMLSSDFCNCKCNHAPLARLCSDELWEGSWGDIVSVLTLWLRQFQHRLPLLYLYRLVALWNPTVMYHVSKCARCVVTDTKCGIGLWCWGDCSLWNWWSVNCACWVGFTVPCRTWKAIHSRMDPQSFWF